MNQAAPTNGDRATGGLRPRRPRVLVSAFSCCPDHGSEPGIGWFLATGIARHADAWVLTDAHDWESRISVYTKQHGPIPNLEFVYVPRPEWEYALETKPLLSYFAYRRWLRRAYGIAERLHAQVNFDLAHQLTFTSFREPGYLRRLGIPFAWGPLGGAQNYPWRFLHGAGIATASFEAVRTVLNTIQLYGSQRIRAAAKSAAAIFATNSDHQRKFRRALGVESTIVCDVGATAAPNEIAPPRPTGGPIRIVWVGLLTARKALELLIEALALVPRDVPFELRVLGEGPRRGSWERLAERRGIAAKVQWLGKVPHEEALEHFRWADVFAFTSLRDATGTVVFEALSAGKPIVCLDHQGVGEIVTPQCGIKIPVTNRRDVERRLCDAIVSLQKNSQHCERLGQGARERAAEYLWSLNARRIAEQYDRILKAAGSDARCELEDPTDFANEFRRETIFEDKAAQLGSVIC